jgi:Fur family ferric uptake transcriptional regulator
MFVQQHGQMPLPVDDHALRASIRGAGLRATGARVAVLRALASASGPVSHADVCAAIGSSDFDRATVYRNLVDLTRANLARRSDVGDHIWRFEATVSVDGHDDVHPHFVCMECGNVACLPEGAVRIDRRLSALPAAMRAAQVEVHVRGRCDGCAS